MIPWPNIRPTSLRILAALLVCLVLMGVQVSAQTSSPTPAPKESKSELEAKLTDVAARLEEIKSEEAPSLISDDSIPSFQDSLRLYDLTLRRRLSLMENKSRLLTQVESLEQELNLLKARGLDEPRPYSINLLDRLQAEFDLALESEESAELAAATAKTSKKLKQSELVELQASRRRVLDDLKSDADNLTLTRNLEKLETAEEAALSAVELAEAEIELADIELAADQRRQEILRLKLQIVQEGFRFTAKMLKEQLESLETERKELRGELNVSQVESDMSTNKLDVLKNDDTDDSEQEAEMEAREEWVATHQLKESMLERRLESNLARRELWERRFKSQTTSNQKNFDEWSQSTKGLILRLDKNQEVYERQLSQIRSRLAELLSQEPDDEAHQIWQDVRVQALLSRQKSLELSLNYLQDTESLARRLVAELSFHEEAAPLTERAAGAWRSLVNFWNIELYTMGDSSITVGKLSVAVCILVLGLSLVGRVTRFLSSKFLVHLPVRQNVRFNLERLLRYFFILLVFLFSLHVVNIPLTIFTFLGGTLAIAVGFGAQNILNNFISGLILMLERPVSVGDLIEVNDTLGFVEEIGARSTRVKVPRGIHVILPNSSLLENKVVNWTLEDHKIRVQVGVGVAYGSSPQQIIELMTQACTSTESVHETPAPTITFDEFADSSLNFTAHFWVSVHNPLDRDRVTTEVRIKIDTLFKEHNISIPFPQRDLNLNSPIKVELLEPEVPENAEE